MVTELTCKSQTTHPEIEGKKIGRDAAVGCIHTHAKRQGKRHAKIIVWGDIMRPTGHPRFCPMFFSPWNLSLLPPFFSFHFKSLPTHYDSMLILLIISQTAHDFFNFFFFFCEFRGQNNSRNNPVIS